MELLDENRKLNFMLDLRRLRLLRELRDRGTVVAVADAFNYTPSAVSQQLAALEREAGVPLLERLGRGVRLTDAAHRLAAHTDDVLARLEEAEAELAAASGAVRGRVRIAAFQTAARSLVAPVLRPLADLHDGLRLELVEVEAEEALPLLRAGDVDVVVAEEYRTAPRAHEPALERVDLGRDQIMVVLPRDHPAAEDGRPVPLRRLAADPWCSTLVGTLFDELIVRACRAAGFEPDVRHRANDVAVLLDLAADGHGVALIPALGQPDAHPRIAVRPVAGRGIERRLYAAVRRGGGQRPPVAATLTALRDRAAAIGLAPR
jgi:DNA-binding transcriptional LysR family regulator